jgi:hypothetical protein
VKGDGQVACLSFDEDRAFVSLWYDEDRLLFYAVEDRYGDDAVRAMLFSCASCFVCSMDGGD